MDHQPESAGKATYMALQELGASRPGRAERAEMKGATCTLSRGYTLTLLKSISNVISSRI